jgi:hypothetical protein
MKKILPLFIAFSLYLTGCASQDKTNSTDINNPYEISVNGKILSYYDTKDNIDTNIFEISDSMVGFANKSENMVDIDDNGQIRCIVIANKSITTYKNISVGDSVNKINESFKYEYNWNNNYMVIFNNGVEEDPMNQDKENNWLGINYITDGEHITHIQICDVKFGNEMR